MDQPSRGALCQFKNAWVALLCAVFSACGRPAPESSQDPARAEIRGQPIRASRPPDAASAELATNSSATNQPVPQEAARERTRRYRKPLPLEQRMVSFLATNAGGATYTNQSSSISNALSVEAPLSAEAEARRGFAAVNFALLAGFPIKITEELADASRHPEAPAGVEALIPNNVKALNNKRISIRGFLVPTRMDNGLTVEFLLMRDQSMCCFGGIPNVNEWISVRSKGKGVEPVMDEPIIVRGELHVGDFRENGLLTGIYKLDAEEIEGP